MLFFYEEIGSCCIIFCIKWLVSVFILLMIFEYGVIVLLKCFSSISDCY